MLKSGQPCLDLAIIALHSERMSKESTSHTRLSDKGRAQLDERRSRQAQALRDNLRKRKAQMRERTDPSPVMPAGAPEDAEEDNGEP